MKAQKQVIVVGGGLGGLWAALRIAAGGQKVTLFSLFEVKRSHSVCAQGGINAVLDAKGQNDSIEQHILDTIKGGAYLANQPPIKSMCESAPGLIRTFERMGVTFSRTAEGLLDQRLFGGVKKKRTCFAGASTGQQLLYGVDEQIRRYEAEGLVIKHECWEFLSLIQDRAGVCCGIIAMDLRSHEIKAFPADGVVLATGGMGKVYGHRTTTSSNATGAAATRAWLQGASLANTEFFQFHPTAMLGDDKNRLMSEAARGEGGRIWVPKNPQDQRDALQIPEADRFYFLEDWYPTYGNTVPRDVASRAIWKVTRELALGIQGQDKVYLDISHLERNFAETRLGAILDIYRKFQGVDPVSRPMEIFPAAHYAMGGLWVDFEKDQSSGGIVEHSARNHATKIPGLYACGECDYGYHGANRLGANSLLSASYSGKVAGEAVLTYLQSQTSAEKVSTQAQIADEAAKNQRLLASSSGVSPYQLHHELGQLMTDKVGVVRDNRVLDQAIGELADMAKRAEGMQLDDVNGFSNASLAYARQVQDMIRLGQVIAASARARDECRGAHFKPEFELPLPENAKSGDEAFEAYRAKWQAQNEQWLKTTMIDSSAQGPKIHYEAVDTSWVQPTQPRDYR